MADGNCKIIVEVLDAWIEDDIARGYAPMKSHILMKIGDKLELVTRDIIEE